jgi:hypothetical protein
MVLAKDAVSDREARIRARAHQIWLDEGKPDGRADFHWAEAAQIIAMEDDPKAALRPVEGEGPYGEPVEPAVAVENQGEFPVLDDQGDKQTKPPIRRAPRKAAPRRKQ